MTLRIMEGAKPMKKLIRCLAVLFLLFIVSKTALADVFNEQGERAGSTFEEAIENSRAASQAKADAYREQTRLQAEATMAAAAIPQTSRPLTNAEADALNTSFGLGSQAALEAGRIAFIAKGRY